MRNYWIFNTLITVLFIVSTILFYKSGFHKTSFIFYLGAALIFVVLSTINYRANYKK